MITKEERENLRQLLKESAFVNGNPGTIEELLDTIDEMDAEIELLNERIIDYENDFDEEKELRAYLRKEIERLRHENENESNNRKAIIEECELKVLQWEARCNELTRKLVEFDMCRPSPIFHRYR